jgi:hypothetical protein
MSSIRTYSELIRLPTFEERFQYCKLFGKIGIATFGFDRYLNQKFYSSREWRLLRDHIIVRDKACDLAVEDRPIIGYDDPRLKTKNKYGTIRVHHLNPITVEDFESGLDLILDPEFLICTSLTTHNAIHFGDEKSLIALPQERRKGDTAPWKVF